MSFNYQLIAALAASLFLIGCNQANVRAQEDDQIGQSGQGKDRLEYNAETGSFVVDLGRDKAEVRFYLKRRSDGALDIEYAASAVSGLRQAELRARLEAEMLRATQQGNREMMSILERILRGIR